jgi:hypothetical protein
LDWGCRQHKDESEPPFFEGATKALGHLRGIGNAVEIAKLVRFIEDEHVKAIPREIVEVQPGRIVGRDDSADVLWFGLDQILASSDVGWNVELRLKFTLPLWSEQLRTDNQYQLSASDLVGHLNCRHLTRLDVAVANGQIAKPKPWDPLLEVLWERRLAHEQSYITSLEKAGFEVVDGGSGCRLIHRTCDVAINLVRLR